MSWQRAARLAIAAFVILFAGFVFVAMRRTHPPKTAPAAPNTDPNVIAQTFGPAKHEHNKDGKLDFSLTFVGQKTYSDGRNVLQHVTLTVPDKDGRAITVTGDEADVAAPPDATSELSTATLRGNVRLTTSDGALVSSSEASYDNKEGLLKVPGPVTFSRGRLTGKGIGATYDNNRDVLWLLDQAQIFVAPDETGAGKVEASAASAGLARGEHYFRLSKSAHIVADNRIIDADDITAQLTPDDQRIQTMQLRNNSRIVGTGGGAQSMSAKDIDLTYGPDGRALQHAHLVEQSVLQLPGAPGSTDRRIAARTIDVGMSPDGAAVTQLNAVDGVVVDLPAEGNLPAKQVRAATLVGSSTTGAGIETATFEGGVQYRETRPAQGQTPAVDRTARSTRLIVQTTPGMGEVQQADFHGNVKIVDGQTTAEAPRALYQVTKDLIDLSPSDSGDPGLPPTVTDGQITVQARTIEITMSTHALKADTSVRSILQRKSTDANRDADKPHLPSMLNQDEPVFVTSNRLEYDPGTSRAKYTGAARLTQGSTEVRGDAIDLDDKNGNLTSRGNTHTKMLFDDVDPKTKQKTAKQTIGTSDAMVYEDAKRLAVYTAGGNIRAHLVGPQGDITADRIELYLKEGGKELDRAEAFSDSGNVLVVDPTRSGKGKHMVYTAADDTYVMTGAPVDVLQQEPTACKQTQAAVVRFKRTDESIASEGAQGVPAASQQIAGKCPERRN